MDALLTREQREHDAASSAASDASGRQTSGSGSASSYYSLSNQSKATSEGVVVDVVDAGGGSGGGGGGGVDPQRVPSFAQRQSPSGSPTAADPLALAVQQYDAVERLPNARCCSAECFRSDVLLVFPSAEYEEKFLT